MNIQNVIANLLNTIEGKEAYLRALQSQGYDSTGVLSTTIKIIEINLKELNAILTDCMAVREADIVKTLELPESDWHDTYVGLDRAIHSLVDHSLKGFSRANAELIRGKLNDEFRFWKRT